jgi:hypothetical protein
MAGTIDITQFQKMRDALIASDTVTKEVPLSSIGISADSIKRNIIEVGGKPVAVSQGFFMKLATLLNMSAAMTNQFLKNEDGKIAVALMNGLKDYRSAHGSANVLLVASSESKSVVDVCDPKKFKRLSNSGVLDIAERILNESKLITIESIDTNPQTGRMVINMLNNEEIGFPKAGKDEFFKFGFSLVQAMRSTYSEGYNSRLVCSNGMRASLGSGSIGGNSKIAFTETFHLASGKANDVQAFLQNIEKARSQGFVPPAFNTVLTSAMHTPASLLEVEHSMKMAQRLVVEDNPDMKKLYTDAVRHKYFDGYSDAMARATRAGHDPSTFSDRQKAMIRSGQSVWEVVNSLTYLGSNNSGIPLSNKHDLKHQAGVLFGKGTQDGFDCQNSGLANL